MPNLAVSSYEKLKLMESFMYFKRSSEIAFSWREELDAICWDSFIKLVHTEYPITNCLLVALDYRKKHREFLKGEETDLRKAPSLFVSRDDYIEGVSAEMWFGDAFWKHAACTKNDVLYANWLEVENCGDLLHVKAWPEPFTTDEGEQGEIQRRLLRLLFGIR